MCARACLCLCLCLCLDLLQVETHGSFIGVCRVYALTSHVTGKPGPAEEAGIRVNDIVVSINDTEGINSTKQVDVIGWMCCEV